MRGSIGFSSGETTGGLEVGPGEASVGERVRAPCGCARESEKRLYCGGNGIGGGSRGLRDKASVCVPEEYDVSA